MSMNGVHKYRRMSLRTGLMVALCAVLSGGLAAQPVAIDPADYETFDPALVRLGQALFYDPILSGNRNISCATCHHPRFATGDGLSLGLGEGGVGLGPARRADQDNAPEQHIPRNAPPLFNLGHRAMTVLFHDGRIEQDASRPSGIRTPLDDEMTSGFASVLSAQTMFPVLSPDEMAGHYQENDVAKLVRQGRLTGPGGAWDVIAARVDGIAAYRKGFAALDPEVQAGAQVSFTDISDAIAAFMAVEWRADDSPFDAYLRGQGDLSAAATRGLDLFFGAAQCSRCHSGPLLSDQGFHAMAQPQLGPGKAERFEQHQRDVGRMRITGHEADAYAFRTPMLRNVTETGPWGHAGAYADLRAFLRQHADPVAGLASYRAEVVISPLEGTKPLWNILEDPAERAAIAGAFVGERMTLSDAQISDLLAFLGALRDERALAGRLGIPDAVPSGLPVDR